MEWTCKCGGTITEESSGIDWDDIDGDCIARSDLVCEKCGLKFNVFYNLDRVECQECEENVENCKCKGDIKEER